MPKSKIAADIIARVASETDTSRNLLFSNSRIREVVDARSVAIKLMSDEGLYPSDIAKVFGITPRSVSYAITAFDNRIACNRFLTNIYKKLKRERADAEEK